MESKIVKKIEKPFTLDNFYLPGSKSITLRDFLLAGLAEGESIISRAAICDDALRMRDCLERLGVKFEDLNENEIKIYGTGGKFLTGEKELFLGGSGVSARFLIALALLRQDKTILTGDKSLSARPQEYLLEVIKDLGAVVTSKNNGYLPVEISGGNIIKNKVKMSGDKSSQYFSALMQIAPLLPSGLEIEVEGDLVSKPYIDITINEMKKFGAVVENIDYQFFKIKPQKYRATNLTVEGDASAASYFMALATIHGGSVSFKNIDAASKQGDINFYKICEQLGAKIELNNNGLKITGPQEGKLNELKNEINMEDIPDTAQTLMMMAPLIPGKTKIIGISTLKFKECDRINAPATELFKLGVEVETGDDYIIINGKKDWDYDIIKNTSINTYNDHRMAMSFAVLATLLGDLKINDPDCVKKSFPNFWEVLDGLY